MQVILVESSAEKRRSHECLEVVFGKGDLWDATFKAINLFLVEEEDGRGSHEARQTGFWKKTF